jgi:MraZ protein
MQWHEVVASGELGSPGAADSPSQPTTWPDSGEARRVFTGEYRHSVDEKGRMAVPSRFRIQLEEGAFIARWIDACLAIFPRSEWDALASRAGALPIGDTNARQFQRFLFSSAFEVDLDRQGRMVIPASLRSWAGLNGEAVVVGSRDHAEIWAPARWEEARSAMESPEAMAEHLSGLGI